MRFITLLLKNLVRRKSRTALTILGVTIAVATLVTLRGVSQGFHRSFLENLTGRGADLIVSERGKMPQDSKIPESYYDLLINIPGVREVHMGLEGVVSVEGNPAVLIIGWELNSPQIESLTFLKGRPFSETGEGEVLLGEILAENLGKGPGDTVELYDKPYTVVGVFRSFTIFENGAGVLPLDVLQEEELFGEQLVTGFTMLLDRPNDDQLLDEVRRQVDDLTDEDGQPLRLTAHTPDRFVDEFMLLRVAKAMALITSVIAILIGAVGMLNTMVMSVLERVKEIGILRAIGWKRSRIVRMILGESMLLSLVGAGVGIGAGILAMWWLTQIPGVNGYIDGRIAPSVYLEGIAMAVAVGLIGGLYPAYRASRLLPTEALRHE